MSSKFGERTSKNRLETLTDGVFAIVMTLLVLELTVPHLSPSKVTDELPKALLELSPVILSYITSFIILGFFWIAHHDDFSYIKHADRILLWITIFYLMTVAFIPFSTSLLGQYGNQQISVIIYGSNIIITGFINNLQWWYATKNHRLVDDDADLDPALITSRTKRALLGLIGYIIAIAISFVNIQVSIILFIIYPLYFLIPPRKTRSWLFFTKDK